MPAKSKDPKSFKVGERASVRYIRVRKRSMNCVDEIVDTGFISEVYPDRLIFTSDFRNEPGRGHSYIFRRKGDRWVEMGKDCYTLE